MLQQLPLTLLKVANCFHYFLDNLIDYLAPINWESNNAPNLLSQAQTKLCKYSVLVLYHSI